MSFATRVATTYGTFVVANWGSNFLLFPDKKLDYGFANRLLGRPVNNEWCVVPICCIRHGVVIEVVLCCGFRNEPRRDVPVHSSVKF